MCDLPRRTGGRYCGRCDMLKILWPLLFTPVTIPVPWPRWRMIRYWFREWRQREPCCGCGRRMHYKIEEGASWGVRDGRLEVECAACRDGRGVVLIG